MINTVLSLDRARGGRTPLLEGGVRLFQILTDTRGAYSKGTPIQGPGVLIREFTMNFIIPLLPCLITLGQENAQNIKLWQEHGYGDRYDFRIVHSVFQ